MGHGLVAVVDDDDAVRLSTASLLMRAGFDARLFESGDIFLSASHPDPISCILLDMQMPGSNGLAVLRVIGTYPTPPPVIVITGHGDVPAAVEAMKLGAYDFVEKPYDAAALLGRIEGALSGRAGAKGTSEIRAEAAALVAALSRRQQQVLKGVVRGLQNKMIAYELDLSIRTVEAYRGQVLHRLGCRGTADAVRVAIAAGLLEEAAGPDPAEPAPEPHQ